MRVTFWDIEATDLAGNFGRLLSCSFLDLGAKKAEVYRRDVAPHKGRKLTDDSKLAVAIRDRAEKADILVGWNSILYDQPMVNARLAAAGERPLRLTKEAGTIHLDLMYYASGSSLRLGGRSLANVSKFFKTASNKTPLTGEIWAEAAAGEKDAMDLVVEHNVADVEVLRDLWGKLAPYVKKLTFPLADVWPFIQQIPARHR